MSFFSMHNPPEPLSVIHYEVQVESSQMRIKWCTCLVIQECISRLPSISVFLFLNKSRLIFHRHTLSTLAQYFTLSTLAVEIIGSRNIDIEKWRLNKKTGMRKYMCVDWVTGFRRLLRADIKLDYPWISRQSLRFTDFEEIFHEVECL